MEPKTRTRILHALSLLGALVVLVAPIPLDQGHLLMARIIAIEVPVFLILGPLLTTRRVTPIVNHAVDRVSSTVEARIAELRIGFGEALTAQRAELLAALPSTKDLPTQAALDQRFEETVAALTVHLDQRLAALPPPPTIDLAATEARLLAGLKQHTDGFLRQLQEHAAQEETVANPEGKDPAAVALAAKGVSARQQKKFSRAAAESALNARLAEHGLGPFLPAIRTVAGGVWDQAVDAFAGGHLEEVQQILAPIVQLVQKQAGQAMSVPTPPAAAQTGGVASAPSKMFFE